MGTGLTVAVLALVAVRLVLAARVAWSAQGRRRSARIVSGLRWHHLAPVPVVLAAVLAVATVLVAVPGLDWGWWSALGGDGNPAFGATSATAGTAWEWLIPLVFIGLLAPALPLFAEAEEQTFRRGAQGWSWQRRTTKTVSFGLVHALIGIPVGVALALSVGGAYFLARYLRCWRRGHSEDQAVAESTRAHLAYNLVILPLVLIWAIVVPFVD